MGVWQNIKMRLGLEEEWDEEYEEYYDEPHDLTAKEDDVLGGSHESPHSGARSVRRLEREADAERGRSYERRPHLRGVPSADDAAPQVRMHIVEPKTFTEAQSIADRFKQGTPVIMNLTMTSPDLAKRLLDFASGLTYGLNGGLQKVSEKVFMLTPANVDVSAGDMRRIRDNGLFGVDG